MRYRYLILFVVLAGGLASCARMQPQPIQDVDIRLAESLVQEKKFKEAAELYENVATRSLGTALGAEALFSAARVRCQYDNPQKEYQHALQNLDEFLKTYPDNELAGDAQDRRSLIRTILELKKENERLSNSIEELKRVDIRHEEQRQKQ
jgi:outer membrane protein assembly factor BamD (BamD/ComL family)